MRRERRPRQLKRADPPACRACGARILFAYRPASGKWVVLDHRPDPTHGDTAVVHRGRKALATVLEGPRLHQARADGMYLFRDHHATCPAAPAFRQLVTEERFQ